MRTTAKLFLGLAVFVFIACSDQIDVEINELGEGIGEVLDVVSGETFYSSLFVTTYDPDVQEEKVEFKGEIIEMKEPILVTYGFMWYDANDPNVEITRIELGETTEKLAFSAELTDLPKKDNLVVCTFLRQASTSQGEGNGEQPHELIGDEIAFSNL